MPGLRPTRSAVGVAMVGAAAVIGQFVGGKATRDALFLARFDVTALPLMVMAGSIFSIGCAFLMSRALSRIRPARLLPAAFAGSGVLVLAEWLFAAISPRAGAVVFYLHMLGLAPVLVSGFWTLLSERFDPRTAKRRLGQVGAAATFGGLVASLVADRAAVWGGASAMLPLLAAMNGMCAWAVRQLGAGRSCDGAQAAAAQETTAAPPQSGLKVLARAPHLRNMAALVFLTTVGAGLVDYVFKATAVAQIGRGDTLLRFFALYYGGQSVLTFLAQVTMSRAVLERLGLAPAVASPSLTVVAGGLGALAFPGLPSILAARGGEFVCRMSLFRSAYELLYTPVPARQKRAAKSIIDVAVDRTGDLAGAGVTRLVLALARSGQHTILLFTAVAASAAALLVSRRVTRGYVDTLERSLLDQAVRLDLSEAEDRTTRETVVRTLGRMSALKGIAAPVPAGLPRPAGSGAPSGGSDAVVQRIVALRSRDRDEVLRVLRDEQGPEPALVSHVIPLLAWDVVACDAIAALRKVAGDRVGQLVDAMLDQRQDFAIRRRIARVLSACASQRAVDGLLLALDDRFEVRFQCGRSLAAITDRNPELRVDRERIYQVVLREVSVGRPVWESRRLLDALDTADAQHFVDRFIGERAGQSMAQVFTLLSLVLHREPLQIAFRGLHVDDVLMRGTALEYLESVLPDEVRARLWPFLEDSRPSGQPSRSREEILADLLRSNDSIVLQLAELERRDAGASRGGPHEHLTAGTA